MLWLAILVYSNYNHALHSIEKLSVHTDKHNHNIAFNLLVSLTSNIDEVSWVNVLYIESKRVQKKNNNSTGNWIIVS